MKRLNIIISILLSNLSFSQNCELTFSEIWEAVQYDLSEYDDFAMDNGFEFYQGMYVCGEMNEEHILVRYEDDEGTALSYDMPNQSEYRLLKKKISSEGELIDSELDETDNTLRLNYSYDGRLVILSTYTVTNEYGYSTTSYSITIRYDREFEEGLEAFKNIDWDKEMAVWQTYKDSIVASDPNINVDSVIKADTKRIIENSMRESGDTITNVDSVYDALKILTD